MNLTIKQILREGLINEITVKDAWTKFYSNVEKFPILKGDESLFQKLNDIYPRKGDNFNKGYFTWLYNLVRTNQLKEEDFYKAKEYLRLFDKFINRIPNESRDINKFKSLNDLYDVVKGFEDGEETMATSNKDEIRQIKQNEIDKVFENGDWLIMIPKTERASCLIGKGTQWCTAAEQSNNMFDHYNSDGPLYVLVNKDDNKKYQLHFESNQLMDENDRAVEASYFFDHVLEDSDAFQFLQGAYDNFWDFILINSAEDIANGGYSETFEEALNSDTTPEVLRNALSTLRYGSDSHSVYLGFVYEKDPDNIGEDEVLRLFDADAFDYADEDDVESIFRHLTEIGYDFDQIGDENVSRFNNAKQALAKHKVEMDKEYKTDKGRTLRVNKINFGDESIGEYNVTMDGQRGDVNLETLLNLLHQGQLFESKNAIKQALRENINTCDCCKYFDTNSYENYDGLTHPLYTIINKSKSFSINYIAPKQYLYSIARGFGVSYEDSMMHVSKEKVQKYVNDMKNGDKFPIGYYEDNKPNQEGRHRAVALLEIGCQSMPIVVIKNLTPEQIKKVVLTFKDFSKEELDAKFKHMGYHGISSLDWRELQNYITYKL